MSSIKTDVLWSPNHEDKYMTFGTDLSLFQVERIQPGQQKVEIQLSDDTFGTLLSSNTSHQYMKCVAWCPRPVPDHLVAVGHANGRVKLTSFGKGGTGDPEGLIGKQFVPRHPRQCNSLMWNPLDPSLLAESLEKHRVDYSILIWDVNSKPTVSAPVTPERGHTHVHGSANEHNVITKPVIELGPGETTLSCNWSPHEPKTLVAGMNNKFLRIYDLRDTTHPRSVALNKAVYGVTVDPQCEYRLASFVENQVLIWDVRSFDKPVLTFQETRGILKIAWSPTRFGLLASLAKDSSVVKLYDVQHSGLGSDELEPAIIERLVHPYGHNAVASFAWHPTIENRMLTVTPTGILRDVRIFERIALTWSPSMYLLWSCGKKLVECIADERTEDISMIMKSRAKLGYGLQDPVYENADLAEDCLRSVWYWLDLMKNLQSEGRVKGTSKPLNTIYGAKAVLRGDLSGTGVCSKSELIPNVQWIGIDHFKYGNKLKMFRSEERSKAMELCGWDFDRTDSSLKIFLENLEAKEEYERAATIALFNLKMRLAIEVLKKGGVSNINKDGRANLNMVAMAISGYADDRNQLWKENCGSLRSELDNAYLRGMFAFLTGDTDFEDVVNESGMALQDRVAFACMYLNDSKLNDFIEKTTAKMIETGNLDGILLTGLSKEGLDLLQKYVDITGDVQTASLVVIQGFPSEISKDIRVTTWIDSYRDLLDRWRLWHERAEFDVHRFHCDTSSRPPQQVFVSCNFCGKSISYSMLTMGRTRNYPSFGGSPNKSKVTSCPGCRKPLPRCSLCLMNMGTASGVARQKQKPVTSCPGCRKPLPRCSLCLMNMGTASGVARQKQKPIDCDGNRMTGFPKWFTWCQSCRHGGHAIHIANWFREHTECPVTGCSCKCMTLDSAGRLPSDHDLLAVKAS